MAIYTETIELKDQVSGTAAKAAAQVKTLESAIASTENALTKAQATGNTKKYMQLSSELAQYKTAMEAIPKAVPEPAVKPAIKATNDLGKNAEIAKTAVVDALGGIGSAFRALQSGDIHGVVSGITDSVAGLAGSLDILVPGLGKAAASVVRFVGTLASVVISLAEFSIESAEGKTRLLAMGDAFGQGKFSGEQFDDMLTGLSSRIGMTKDQLQPFSERMSAMGFNDLPSLEQATLASASAFALFGDQGVSAFENVTQKIVAANKAGSGLKLSEKQLSSLYKTGVTVADVAAKMGVETKKLESQLRAGTASAEKFGEAFQSAVIEKGAGPLEKLGNSAKQLKSMFMQNLGDMFEDIDIAPFMASLKDLTSIFGATTNSGKALKTGLAGGMQAIFDAGTRTVPMVKHFLLDVVIFALQAYIAFKPLVRAFDEMNAKTGDTMSLGQQLGLVASGLGLMASFAVQSSVGIGYLYLSIVKVRQGLFDGIAAILMFGESWSASIGKLILDAPNMAANFVSGLVNGITSGAVAVGNAVSNLATSAKKAFEKTLGIASPSKVMFEKGAQTAEGAERGVESGIPGIEQSSAKMGQAAAGGVGESSAGAPASSGSSMSFVFQDGAIRIGGSPGEQMSLTEAAISILFEKVAMQKGLTT